MKVETTALDGVLKVTPPTNFEDFRGNYVELYNKRLYREASINHEFIQDDISTSRKHVLRGIHGDSTTWKLISCLHGAFYLVVINHNQDSPQYKRWQGFTLTDRNRLQILVPPLFGNGHLVLSETAIFYYKQTTEYDRARQFTILWNDPEYGIWWPVKTPILSIRDEGLQ